MNPIKRTHLLCVLVVTIFSWNAFSYSSLDQSALASPELLLLKMHSADNLFQVPEAFLFDFDMIGKRPSISGVPYRPFTIIDLKRLIKSKKISKISELIPELPPSFSGSRVEVYKSKSLQCATAKAPRVIMFSLDASLFCSFNSGVRDDYKNILGGMGCELTTEHLECLSRNENGLLEPSSFVFQEEVQTSSVEPMPLTKQVSDIGPEEIETIGSIKVLHRGKVCAACHLSNYENGNKLGSRVIWDQYFLWPGSFGSVDDDFVGEKPDREKELLAEYLSSKADRPRYSNLPKLIIDRPNFAMNNLQTISNADRIVRSIYYSPHYKEFKSMFVAAANRCSFNSNSGAHASMSERVFVHPKAGEIASKAKQLEIEYVSDSKAHGEGTLAEQKEILGEGGASSGRLSDGGNSQILDVFPRLSQQIAKKSNYHLYRAIADTMNIPIDFWSGNADLTSYYFNAGHSSEVPVIVDRIIKEIEPQLSCKEIK